MKGTTIRIEHLGMAIYIAKYSATLRVRHPLTNQYCIRIIGNASVCRHKLKVGQGACKTWGILPKHLSELPQITREPACMAFRVHGASQQDFLHLRIAR